MKNDAEKNTRPLFNRCCTPHLRRLHLHIYSGRHPDNIYMSTGRAPERNESGVRLTESTARRTDRSADNSD